MKKFKKLILSAYCSLLIILMCGPSAFAYPLYIGGAGGPGVSPGGGTVTSADSNINCGSTCSEDIAIGATTTLTFHPTASVSFDSWNLYGGSCSEGTGTPTCTFTSGSYGSFAAQPSWHYTSYIINIVKTGDGAGTVSGSGINCGTSCSSNFSLTSNPINFSLTATAASGSAFAGWDASSDRCYALAGVGKGSYPITNTSANCSDTIYSGTKQVYQIKAIFNKATTSDPTTPTSSHSSTQSGTSSPTTPDTSKSPTSGPVSLTTINVGESKVDIAKPVDFTSDKPLVLSGKTVPNGVVTLTIHSTPKTVTTTADKDGNWSYTVSGLEPGSHTIQANVKDPATGQTSSPVQLLAFTVKAAPVAAVVKTVPKASSKMPLAAGLVILLAAAGTGLWFWKKKSTATAQSIQLPQKPNL